jgi:isoleucyl-tRNA synthetase
LQDKAKEPALGADTLRFWVASSTYTKEANISIAILQAAAEGLRKVRNTVRFILGNLAASSSNSATVPPELSVVSAGYVLRK